MRWLDSIPNAMDMNLGKHWEMVRDREAWCTAVHGVGHDSVIEHQQAHHIAFLFIRRHLGHKTSRFSDLPCAVSLACRPFVCGVNFASERESVSSLASGAALCIRVQQMYLQQEEPQAVL